MVGVVPVENAAGPVPSGLQTGETLREGVLVREGFELGFSPGCQHKRWVCWVIFQRPEPLDVGKTVGLHERASVCGQDESARRYALAFECCLDKGYRQISRFGFCQKIAGRVTVQDVYDHVGIKVLTRLWTYEPGDVPTPEPIRFC